MPGFYHYFMYMLLYVNDMKDVMFIWDEESCCHVMVMIHVMRTYEGWKMRHFHIKYINEL